MTVNKQAEAILFGLALGDSLGYPVEFMSLAEIRKVYGENGIQTLPESPLYSDDTQMTLSLIEGVLSAGVDADLDTLMTSIGDQFLIWLHSPDNNRSPGLTCLKGLRFYEHMRNWRESGLEESRGCGAAMRVAPLGYFYQHDEARLREVAIATSQITHRHPGALASAMASAYLVKLALDGVDPARFLQLTHMFVDGMSEDIDSAFYRVGHVMGWTDEDRALQHIGAGWTGDEAVALALYCVMRYPDDYRACMTRAVNTNGDSDSIACIAGGIMGARLGLDAIPAEWREVCENRDHLIALAGRMTQSKA